MVKKTLLIAALSIATSLSINQAMAGDPKVVGDIVGRDLNIPLFWALGHVGLWSGTGVVEALDNPTRSIQQNTLYSFKTVKDPTMLRPYYPYWGAKYWNTTRTDLLKKVRDTAINEGRNGSSYTLSKIVTPTSGGKPSRFRCDSLVAYAYYKGMGAYYPEVNPKTNQYGSLPWYVFNSTPKTR